MVAEQGGLSCAIHAKAKLAYFADVILDGTLNYLLQDHDALNQQVRTNIKQNKGLLFFSALAVLAFIVSFSLAGMGVMPVVPLVLMAASICLVIVNAARVTALAKYHFKDKMSWLERFLASHWSLRLVVAVSSLVLLGFILSSAAGGIIPVIAFGGNVLTLLSSVSFIGAG